ncbi:MAG: DUF2283 domain-containing protein [Microgenomates group bacterium]|nr:DUF2283 domain-containing protein [Microgenomates group bacterium]
MEKILINNLQNSIPKIFFLMKKQNKSNLVLNYDKEADVLYISFGEIKKADNSEVYSDNIIVRKKNNDVIGITVLNASKVLH